ncbi:YvrJ-like protein [Salsuginibacillus halophilus]|uniref:YvrJ-like protein n=1 Tax=Salsuginibacillus halophilus TaxID=517424 RepID=A0A2P8H4Y0_9BACI|nr:YvrJ-like protein [Salsuginibacillus halophilus]
MDWAAMIAEVSFPILVTFYLLSRIEGRLNDLTGAIHELKLTERSARSYMAQEHPPAVAKEKPAAQI